MTITQLYPIINMSLSVLCIIGVLLVVIRHLPTIRQKKYLRWVYPIQIIIYLFFGTAYGLVWLVPSDGDAIGRSVLRPAVPSMLLSLFVVVWLVTREAERLRLTQADLQKSEAARLAEREALMSQREALQREREDFITTVLHEINTPLTPLLAYAAMLAEADDLTEAKRLAHEILRSTGRFSVLKMLTDARFKPMDVTAFEICSLVQAVLADEYLFVATRRTRDNVVLDPTCEPFLVEADYQKLYVLVWELVRNAIKAIPHTRKTGRVVVAVASQNGHFTITVQDNGRGIPQDKTDAIWLPGVQIYKEIMTRPNEGSGYGLDTVRKIATAHGGRAWLDWTNQTVGSRFIVELPRR